MGLENNGLSRATGQSHIGQKLIGAQVLDNAEETVVMVIPLEEELFLLILHLEAETASTGSWT